MTFRSMYLLILFLGIFINNHFDSALAENHVKVEKPDQEQQTVEATTREDQTKSTNHDVGSIISENQTKPSGSVEQRTPSTESGSDAALESENEIAADELDDTSMHNPEKFKVSKHQPENVQDLRPKFRRYYDYVYERAIMERYADDKWERIVPAPKPDSQLPDYNTNISHFSLLENGTRIERRSKYDFSYDEIHWYRPTRVGVNISHPEQGTIVKYKFGPKKWLSPFRNRVFASGDEYKTYEDMAPGRDVYLFGTEESFFRPPANHSTIRNTPNGTRSQAVYRYGPVTERSQNASRPDSNWRSRYKFGRMNQYYGHNYPRDQYPPRGWNNGRYNRPYNDRYPYNYPQTVYDQRQQYGGIYDDRNYAPYPYNYGRSNHYQDRGYDQRYDDYDRRRYDDGRHYQQYGDPQTGRKYDQGYRDSYNDQRYGETQYDGRRYDQGYGQGYDDRKRNYQPNNAYEERKADRPTYRESAGSYNGSSYQQSQQSYGRGNYKQTKYK